MFLGLSVILLSFICVSLISTTISLFIPHRQRAITGQFCREGSLTSSCASYPLTHADLTPAIDKFKRFPSTADDVTSALLSAKGPAPSGPDPFHLVKDELESLADHVKKAVDNENSVLSMAASHFFMKVIVSKKLSGEFYHVFFYSLANIETREELSANHCCTSWKSFEWGFFGGIFEKFTSK